MKLRHLGIAAALAAIPLMAQAQTAQVQWRQISCERSQLELFNWMHCRISADETVEKNLKGTARHYATLGQTADASAGMVLSVPQDNGYFTPYPQAESALAIRTVVSGSQRQVDQWGPISGFDRTAYMPFTSAGMNCVGFDHGGRPHTDASLSREGTPNPGYLFLLRGYFCERGPITDPAARVKSYLQATRIGPAMLERNAMGNNLEQMNSPLWRVSAAPASNPRTR